MSPDVLDPADALARQSIRSAEPELTRRNLNPADYTPVVLRDGEAIIVLFKDPDAPANARGSVGRRPALEVQLSPDGREVTRANFVR